MTPPTMPACNAAFDPPRDASTAPVQKPDICHVTCHYVSPSVPPRLPASSRPAVRSVPPLSLVRECPLRVSEQRASYAKACRASKQARVCCAFQPTAHPVCTRVWRGQGWVRRQLSCTGPPCCAEQGSSNRMSRRGHPRPQTSPRAAEHSPSPPQPLLQSVLLAVHSELP
jgi:hypothetical protein